MNEPHAFDDVFNIPPRIYRRLRVETVELPEPPMPVARHEQSGWMTIGMPIISAAVLIGATAALNQGGYGLLFGVPMAVMALMGVVTTLVSNRVQAKRTAAEFAERRAFFETQLQERHAQLQELYDEEARIRRENHPGLEELLKIAGALGSGMSPLERLWERRVGDPDFLEFAIGMGQLPFSSAITVPRPQRDAPLDQRLFAIEQRYRTLDNVPITMPLREIGALGIAGPRAEGLALLRALIWQAAVLHAPTNLRIAVVVPKDAGHDWEIKGVPWLPWLPHTTPLHNDTAFSARMYAREDAAVKQLMSHLLDQLSRRRDLREQQQATGQAPALTPILLIVDGVERVRDQPLLSEIMRHGPLYNMTAIFLVKRWEDIPSECGAMLDLRPGQPRWARAGGQWSVAPFRVDVGGATLPKSITLAKTLAPLKVAESGSNQDVPRSVRLFDLLNIGDAADLQPPAFWSTPPQRAWHPDVPLGLKAGSQPLYIDLYEHMHGSHGMIAGATGAGKSVLLQSLIAALAIKHSPLQLQLLLIDFKGGASLAQLAQLPHSVGFVTDLEGRLAERAMTAIKSEIRRRKALFRRGSHKVKSKIENISEYRAKAPAGLEPLPNLLIVIDEFDEMVQSYREFVAELVRVVKQGRSLGVHLLFASQQPARAVTDDIRTQLKYFIALRLGSSEDSREMLLKPDAAFLPTDIPGRAYFRVGAETTLFQVAQVTGAYQPRNDTAAKEPDVIVIDEPGAVRNAGNAEQSSAARQRETDLDVLVRALGSAGATFLQQEFQRSGWQARPIWQPPLPPRLALTEGAAEQPGTQAWLRVTLGRLDIPQESKQEPFRVSLADAHLAIIGASGSGKTMLLRTLLLSLALSHSPQDVWCYVIDAGGQGLSLFAELPHVGSVIQARDRERVQRLISMLDAEMLRRQDLFRAAGASDLAAYRRQGADLPAWLIVIDKLALLREEFKDRSGYESITEELVRLARIGRSYGIHFVITADSLRDMTYQLLSLFDARIALRLPDLHDYNEVLGGRVSSQIPATLPGRGLWMHPDQGLLELQVALPLLDAPALTTEDSQATVLDSELNADLKERIATISAAWQQTPVAQPPAAIALLPDQLLFQELDLHSCAEQAADDALQVPLGIESINLGVCDLIFNRITPHNLVVGGRRSGKTSALCSILYRLTRRYHASELRLLIIDSKRRGLQAFSKLPHTHAYAVSEAEVRALTPLLEQIQDDHAAACRWLIVIDDYDIGYKNMESQFKSAYGETNLFSVLKQLASDGGESGVHLLIAANIQYPEEAGEVIKILDAGRNGLILGPNKYERGVHLMDVALPIGERESTQPRGRAVLVQEDLHLPMQIAFVPESALHDLSAEPAVEGNGSSNHRAQLLPV